MLLASQYTEVESSDRILYMAGYEYANPWSYGKLSDKAHVTLSLYDTLRLTLTVQATEHVIVWLGG